MKRACVFVRLVLPLALLVVGCGQRVRNWSVCNDVDKCAPGQSCVQNRCVGADGGLDGAAGGGSGAGGGGNGGATAGRDGGGGGGTDGGGDRPDGRLCSCTQAALPVCNPATRSCVQCLTGADCPSGKKACDPVSNTCVECVGSGDCAAPKPACDTVAKICVACIGNTDCAAPKGVCDTASKSCVGCVSGTDCAAPTTVCDTGPKMCVGCLQSTDCSGAKPVCDTAATTCVQCLTSKTDCLGKTPICDAKACRSCKNDQDCVTALGAEPGLCMADGHCAATGEVIFVEFKATGCPGADGSSAKPYCAPNDGVAALAAGHNIIVIRGAANNQMLLGTTGVSPVVIGRKSSAGVDGSIPATAASAVTVTSDNVLIRDLAVNLGSTPTSKGLVATGAATKVALLRVSAALGTGLGVDAESGATLAIDQCYVQNNSAGGVLVNGAGYNIQNSVIAGNGFGVQFTASAITAGSQFGFNTVVGNSVAATCDANNMQNLVASIVVGPVVSCILSNTLTTAPTFSSSKPFHLTAHLACPAAPATFPDHDIDGEPRVAPIDCGADQLGL